MSDSVMRVAITGGQGFVARNLIQRLGEIGGFAMVPITRDTDPATLPALLADADHVIHLAAVNRSDDPAVFMPGNAGFTQTLCDALGAIVQSGGRAIPLFYASSARADEATPYGTSKRAAEDIVAAHGAATGAPVHWARIVNVFGKWTRPNYNSALATFAHNIARGLPISIHDARAPLSLIYIDDLVDALAGLLTAPLPPSGLLAFGPVHDTTVGALADALHAIHADRAAMRIPATGTGFLRALYATYISYLPPDAFAYSVPKHSDPRGDFVEMLKTPDSGQFSYFTSGPGITRGDHYHHSKVEKFLVLTGRAHFAFRHILSGETHELIVDGGDARIVETIPGWTHNITNIGDSEMVVMLWANEIFDRDRPDTFAMKV